MTLLMTSSSFKPLTKSGCRFCDMQNLGNRNKLDEPWCIESNYYSLVSKGALVHGWVLVFPKKHMLNLTDEYMDDDFHNYVNSIKDLIEDKYGKCVVFEHGSNRDNSLTSCGTVHAHLHIVPLELELKFKDKVLAYDTNLKWMTCEIKDVKNISGNSEYLFFSDEYNKGVTSGWICLLEKQTSQFFRRVIAQGLGIPDKFNYKEFAMDDISSETLEHIKANFSPKI
ncbi:hypothetical protein ACIPTZ_07800 [Pectobacterium sp. CHL-2024]|uniref:hypothetical protein n=1 Tax=Pectobacterium sp. CHL-2024 TaxID=3377079 RepID=UPI0037F7B29F